MGDARVAIVDYDPAWVSRFETERVTVEGLLQPWLAGPVLHVGSTAVPSLAAKPVIDMLAPVRSLARAREAMAPLTEAGWLFWPEDPCAWYRLWFLRPSPQARSHHLHIMQAGDVHAVAEVAFRDALRADAGLRERYAGLKRRLAALHPDNRNAYTNGKADFVAAVLRAAGVEVPPRDLLPQ